MLKKVFLMLLSLCGLQSLFAQAEAQKKSANAKNNVINSIVDGIKNTALRGCK